VSVSKRRLTDKELAHRKRVQAATSMAGSTAGLTSLGLLGASTVARKKGLAIAPKLKNASTNSAIVGAGIGGASGFNFASIQNEESKRKQPVSKMGERMAARYTVAMIKAGDRIKGKGGKMYKLRRMAGDAARSLATDASPLAQAATKPASIFAKAYDPEKRRRQRAAGYTVGLAAGSAGGVAYAGGTAARAAVNDRKALRRVVAGNAAQHSRGAQEKKGAGRILRNLDAFEPKSRGGKAVHAKSRVKAAEASMPKNRAAAKGAIKELRDTSRPFKVAGKALKSKPAAIALGGAAAAGAGAVANERHRNRGGKTYNGWWEHRY
jgi:hypothetical protein